MKYPIALLCLTLTFFSCSKSSDAARPEPIGPEVEVPPATKVQLTLPDAFFNEKAKAEVGQSSWVIMDKIISMIEAVPAGDSVFVSIYLINHMPMVEAFIKASNRGVKMKLIVDMSRSDPQSTNPKAIEAITAGLNKKSEFTITRTDVGSNAINHNKFVLFSSLETTSGIKKKVLVQTSHNFTLSDSKKIQDAIVLQHDGLYDAYQAYWEDMKARAMTGMKNIEYKTYSDNAKGISAYFLPRRSGGVAVAKDIIVELLDTIAEPSKATIRIGMSDWISRPAITTKLRELQVLGAKIELVIKSSIGADALVGIATLKANGALVTKLNQTEAGQKIDIHSKFLLIDAPLKGGGANLIATGSHNYTMNALVYNNEMLVQLVDSPLFAKYVNYFSTIRTLPSID